MFNTQACCAYDRKRNKAIAFSILFVVLGAFLYFFVHEFSHLGAMLICNGEFKSISFGIASSVSGYVDPMHITFIALSSIFVPLLITCILMTSKHYLANSFCSGFTMGTLCSTLFGLVGILLITDEATRKTYDVIYALDYSDSKAAVLVMVVFAFIMSCLAICVSVNKITNYISDI